MPGNVFLDSGTGSPVTQCLQAHSVGRQGKNELVLVAFLRLTHELEVGIAQRHVDPTCRAVSGSLSLIEAEESV